MERVAFYTLGCKVNQYETEALTEVFEKAGYETVDFEEKADVYVINTCTVTGLSARKSRQMIRRAKQRNRDSVVAVIGCYPQTAPDEVISIPDVDIIVGTKARGKLVEYVEQVRYGGGKINAVDNIMGTREFEELKVTNYKQRTRAFLKIQEGCSQFCSYCIIPYARGPVRSRAPEDVLEEVENLAAAGFREVVLTGIHLASYGKELKNTGLLDLLQKIHPVEGIERIRLGSIEPTILTTELVTALKELRKLCPHYHVSLQSGCDETLRRMNRKYTTEEYARGIALLREKLDDVAVSTDIMVGFPGETDEEFAQTMRFLKEIRFAQMHVFKYSPRKGTPAAAFKDQVDSPVKEARSRILLEMSRENTQDFNRLYLGRIVPVLFEQEAGDREGYIEGLTANYIRVLCSGDTNLKGNIKEVRLERLEEDYVIGTVVTGSQGI